MLSRRINPIAHVMVANTAFWALLIIELLRVFSR
jgi:hypothetical protein